MGEVAVTMRVMPEEADGFEAMKAEFSARMKPYKVSEKEIGFGVKALYATFIVPDGAGGADRLEEMARAVPGVGEVDVQDMDRL